jgi:hypothetical protein
VQRAVRRYFPFFPRIDEPAALRILGQANGDAIAVLEVLVFLHNVEERTFLSPGVFTNTALIAKRLRLSRRYSGLSEPTRARMLRKWVDEHVKLHGWKFRSFDNSSPHDEPVAGRRKQSRWSPDVAYEKWIGSSWYKRGWPPFLNASTEINGTFGRAMRNYNYQCVDKPWERLRPDFAQRWSNEQSNFQIHKTIMFAVKNWHRLKYKLFSLRTASGNSEHPKIYAIYCCRRALNEMST